MVTNIEEALARLPQETVAIAQYLDCALMVLEEEEKDPGIVDFDDLFELVFFSNYWCQLFTNMNGKVDVELAMKLKKIRQSYHQLVTGVDIGFEVLKQLRFA